MRVDPIKKELLKIPVFKNVYVRRYAFPARVDIILKERIPAAVIKIDLKAKPIAFVTTDGVLITNKNYMALSETKSAIKILVANPKIEKDWTVKRVEHIEKIVRTVEAYSSEKVHYIDMRNPNDVFVRIDSTNIRLGLLDSTVFDRIKRIYTILPQIDEVEGTIKYVDLSWDKVNYFKLQKTEQK
jgi:cell division septal protein FtsQ